MYQTHLYLLTLIMLSSLSGAEDKRKVILFRPQHQRTSGGSLYEFVGLQHTFIGAQAWCEKRGGHLAFIPNEETQYFLQSHMDPKEDTWLGAASTASTNLQDSLTHEGPLSWMDGSPIIYSRWVSRPEPGAACGHVLSDSGYQWKAEMDCNLKLPFVCQYETGRSIICGGRESTLQCGSGQVLMIEGGFYGRRNVHYCRSSHSPPETPTQFQCGWMDITESLKVHCHGHQICRIAEVVDSFGELCPSLGSYLSLDYHCKDGLTLWLSSVAAVIGPVTISVKWLLHLPMGNVSCKLSTGDGRGFSLYSAEGLEISGVHRYHHAGTFVVAAHCIRGDRHITAQRAIAIQELIEAFDVVTCYAGNLSFHTTECKVLHGERLKIQVGVKSGTNVSYSIHSGGMLLSGVSVFRGNVPHNMTITPEMMTKLGPGCHQLKLCASNTVTIPVVCTHLQTCMLERVAGLQASLLTGGHYCSDSPDVTVGVSVERGVPLSLLFSLIGGRSSFSETREMEGRKGIFNFGHQLQEPVQMKIRASNAFSFLEKDVDLLHPCAKDSAVKTRRKHIRAARSPLRVKAFPSSSVYKQQNVTLSVDEASTLTNPQKKYQWECKDPCTCPGEFEGLIRVIEVGCLPQPFEFNKYYFKVKNRADNDVEESESICINFIPTKSDSQRLTCTEGCNQEKKNKKDAKIKFTCDPTLCSNHAWYFKDVRDDDNWKKETRSCYSDAGTEPLRKMKDGGNEYSVSQSILSWARVRDLDITVVVIYEESIIRYNEYVIRTSSSSAATTKNPATVVTSAMASTHSTSAAPSTGVITTTSMTPATTNSRATATDPTSVTSTATTASVTLASTTTGVIRTTTTDETSSRSTASSFDTLKCTISPLTGTILDAFKITCNTESPCSNCQYCFKTQEGKHLRCSGNSKVESVFLPLGDSSSNYSLIITATANCNCSFAASTTITAQVLDSTTNSSSSSVDSLKAAVENAVAQLKEHGVLSGETVGQIFSSVSHKLNSQSDESNKDDRRKLREQMLDIMIATVKEVPSRTPDEVQVTAKALIAVVQRGTELSSSAQMLSLDKNPFSWKGRGNISGLIGALSLTTKDGSIIAVENIREDIEILLPSPVGEQVNSSLLDLGNYSTAVIEVPSVDTTLVLKMVPSQDPLALKLSLGYMEYPTDTNFVATTEMPHQGTTLEERYTWILEPKNLTGNTGVYYLVIRPIVGPGIKSINATLRITSFMTACRFWQESILDWSDYGCRVGVNTSHLVTQCLCNHLTFFGSSFFVTPNLVDPSRSAQLFGTFAENPVIVCFVGALLVVYLLVLVWARRKDRQDAAKMKVTVLEDNDPINEYRYLLSVSTGYRRGASTSSQVTITLLSADGKSEAHHLTDPKRRVFERGAVDLFLLTAPFSLGDLQAIRLWHNNTGSHPAWYVGNVTVQDLQTSQKWHFLCNSWLAIDLGDGTLDKVFHVSTDKDLKMFSNLFFMKTSKDFSDGHLWYSVFGRPQSSTFTCVQRVSCCFSLLLCTMLTSIMFYGVPTDPSEQTMDLGHFEFTWQQFMIGVQSSLIMFPVNILIVSVFRNTRPREISCCRSKTEKPGAIEQSTSSQKTTKNVGVHITLETVIMDVTRIAHSLSETTKSNVASVESGFGPRQEVHDINAVLSVVEDFIKENKTSDSIQLTTHSLVQPQPSETSVSLYPGLTVEGIQMKSNKTQCLYRQLCQIDKELSLLGPSVFHDPHNYSQAVLQVHRMKGLLETLIFKSGGGNPDEPPQRLNLAGNTDDKKHGCCDGGLPWWFIFCGWLLVIATSVVAGYFTMLYGLKFGKDRSMSWLASMTVSFFQSLLITQPLKVLCLSVFFALMVKKVDDEDYQNVEFVENDRHEGEFKDPQTLRQDRSLYEPPPPADIERMRKTAILEQKAFALIREILTYLGFMWMLLLVAYGQRDPNAFYLNNHIQKSFSRNISGSMSPADVFIWANTSLLTNLFGVYPGFITDGNSKLVGSARLRQLRVQKKSCQIARGMLQLVSDCHALYSWDTEDMGSYDPGWNHSMMANSSMEMASPWTYQTQAQLRSYPVLGKDVLFRGGGFVAELGPDMHKARSTLEYLSRNRWLDTCTRAVFVEFTVYNANVNLFCIITLRLETKALGAFQFNIELHSIRLYHSPGGLHVFVMAAEITYLLFILYYMFLQGRMMKQQRWAYFSSVWNLVDLAIILLSWSAVAVFTLRTLLGNRAMDYYQAHKDQGSSVKSKFGIFDGTGVTENIVQSVILGFCAGVFAVTCFYLEEEMGLEFTGDGETLFNRGGRGYSFVMDRTSWFPSFYETARMDSLLQYLSAFLVLLSTVKLWRLFRLNPKMSMITATLRRASWDISGFLMIIAITLVAYSMVCRVVYGWKLSSYRTFTEALMTIIRLQIGIFNYDEVLSTTPVLGALLFGSCIVFMTFMLLNLLVSVILVAFKQEQTHPQPSDEEEIVDMMLRRICGLFGIRYKIAEDAVEPDESASSALKSQHILNNSTMNLNVTKTTVTAP